MRKITLLMKDWLFTYSKDNKTYKVDLPHTWNHKDGQDGGNDYYRAACTYEKEASKPEFNDDEDVYLVFEGVNASATVYFNDKQVATHDGGYSTFRIKVTDLIQDTNKIKVIVDNSVSDKVYPQNADFTFYGGIYRDVYFLVVNKKRFDLDYFGGPGLKYYSEVSKDNSAKVFVTTYSNSDNVVISLLDMDGNLIESVAGKEATFDLENAHLWNGIKDPYLYKIVAKIVENDVVLDEISTNCGIRYFRFDPKKGFFLNGKSYPLHGVSRHQDRKGLGNAISYEMMDEDMHYIRDVGANTIRLAHYQHNQYFYDICDKYGMVVWAEIPYISEHLPNGRENTISQMKELIIQNYNHPSIVTWGLSNEITIKDKHRKDMLDNHHVLQNLCKELDPTRVTSLACFAMCTPFHRVTRISDIIGWNLYLGWYVPFKWLNDVFMWFYHTFWPNRCLCYSEYGAEGMPNLHSTHPHRGDHTEEYQAIYHEYMLKCFARHPYVWGNYVWNMYDFAADARNQGGEPGMNHKGLMTFDRKTQKDSYFIYKAYWSEEPLLHICSKRFVNRTGKKTLIKVYSNQPTVSLYVNDKLVKIKSANKVFKFKIGMDDVNHIVVKAGNLTDECVINKVNKPDPDYKLKSTDSKNWM